MLLLDRQSAPASPHREGASCFQLRLRADGQLLELPPGKTTIGSSPRCNVRIEKPGVQPLHCLIVHEAEGLRVRRWAGDALLNGVPFDETALNAGDCLSIGPVELEVVFPQLAKPATEPVTAPVSNTMAVGQIRVGRDLARSRSRELLATLRRERTGHGKLRQQMADLQEEVLQGAAERKSISGRLESVLADLAAAQQQLNEHKNLSVANQELVSQNQELALEVGELTARVHQLMGEHAGAAQGLQKLSDDHAALDQQHRRLVDENARQQNQASELTNQNTALCGERDELRRQVEQLRAESQALAAEKAAFTEERTAICGERDELRRQNEQLWAETKTLAAEKAEIAEERTGLYGERDELRRQIEQLRVESQTQAAEKAAVIEERTAICGERDELQRQNELLRAETQALAAEKLAIAVERSSLYGERDELHRQNDQLRTESHALASERTAIADERTALYRERNELQEQRESLKEHIAQLHEGNSTMAVAKLAALEQRDLFGQQNEQLQARVAELAEEVLILAGDKSALADELTQVRSENKRLAELERDMREAVVDRESASEELYRALLQIAELQEQNDNDKMSVAAFHSLNNEHQQLIGEVEQLRDQIGRQVEERAAVEGAWQALTGEAAALNESNQRLAGENAMLLTDLDEMRQQFDNSQHDQAAVAGAVAELQRELAAKQQAEAAAAATIAEAERRLADQTRQFTESIDTLEQQLAAAGDVQKTLERAREEWQLHRVVAERQSADQSRRITELEAQLSVAKAEVAQLAALAAAVAEKSSNSVDSIAEPASPSTVDHPAGFNWSSGRTDSFAHEMPNTSGGDDVFAHAAKDEPMAGEPQWNRSSTVAEQWPPATAEAQTSNKPARHFGHFAAADEQHSDAGLNTAEASDVAREPMPWGNAALDQSPFGGDAFGNASGPALSPPEPASLPTELGTSASNKPRNEATSFAEPSIWIQAADRPWSTSEVPAPTGQEEPFDRPAAWEGEAAFDRPAASAASELSPEAISASVSPSATSGDLSPGQMDDAAAKKSQSSSFIERYSHMFADEGPAVEEAQPRAPQPQNAGGSDTSRARNHGVVPPSAAESAPTNGDDEESIEQYMAKLLQRVRGETPLEPGSQAPPIVTAAKAAPPAGNRAVGAQPTSPAMATMLSSLAQEQPASDGGPMTPAPQQEMAKRWTSTPGPATDMGALRALANESARSAISRHELRKHRRNAVTKVIVSALAGVTSLWMMLNSPDWRNIQFIIACVTLLVAAYWAGETFRTLLESFRAAAYDGPEAYLAEAEVEGPPALPIDVEDRQ